MFLEAQPPPGYSKMDFPEEMVRGECHMLILRTLQSCSRKTKVDFIQVK